MVAISEMIAIWEGINIFLQSIQQNKKLNDIAYDKALSAIYDATNETKIYILSLKKRKNHAKQKEKKLSELWIKAGIKLRTIDNDLAQRCIIKADYWANPKEWTEEQIKKSNITLDEIIKESRTLI